MRISILFVSAMAALSASAQTVNIHFNNGTTVNFHEDLIESIDFSEKTPDPTLTAGDAVDLGLSVMWATCNVGATSASESGYYYAWGETQPKSSYKEQNYAYYNASTTVYTNIGSDISGTEYDAATANLGKGWRMPTKAEMDELCKKCIWEWTQVNGVNGYLVKGNNNNIFLPAAGVAMSAGIYDANTYLKYWTSSLSSTSKFAYKTTASSSSIDTNSDFRYYGTPIRPVISYDDYNGTSDYDDSAVTSKVSAYYGGGSVMSNGSTILSGSKLNFYFSNGSSETVLLTGIQLVEGNGTVGSNMLSSDVSFAAGESTGYTITLGKNMTNPTCRFTYRYNNHTYSVDAAYQSYNFSNGRMRELIAE